MRWVKSAVEAERRRKAIVGAVRAGATCRAVARQAGVSLATVQLWVARAARQALDEVDWGDRSRAPLRTRRTAVEIEDLVIDLRRRLRTDSVLGDSGAVAIRMALLEHGEPSSVVPSVRTIGRILERRGMLDGRRRMRQPAPPRGWYLPPVAAGRAEVDSFDFIESLKIAGGPLVDVLTAVSLHGGLVNAWPAAGYTGPRVVEALLGHWTDVGLPHFAQFDNDARFHGSHGHLDTPGPVVRTCLALGVVPVFVPVREHGFQAAIENFNGHWQARVWNRYRVSSLAELEERSRAYVAAHRRRTAPRIERAPRRPELPATPGPTDQGTVIFLRRTSERGVISILGRPYLVDRRWVHRLVRTELDLTAGRIRFYALRRREPSDQPLLGELAYVSRPARRYRHLTGMY